MKVRSEILLIIAIIFIAIIGGVSAGDDNQTDDVVSVSDDSSLVDVPTTDNADYSVTLNESSDIEEDSSDTNDELAGTDVKEESKSTVSVSNSKSNEVLGASNDNEVLGATLASLQTEVDNTRAGGTLSLTQNYVVGTNTADWDQIVINKNIEIRGRNGNQYAYRTLDANGRGSIISITGDRTVTFRYIIFQNAGTGQDNGGAIYVAGGSTVIFDHCIFNNNRRNGDGAAVNIATRGTYTFTDCQFNGNYASGNGGVIYAPAYYYNYGYYSSNTVMSFTRCTFNANTAGGSGAVVYTSGATLTDGTLLMGNSATFEDCDITNNAAGTDAALYICFRTVSINNCDFEGNTAYKDGGAIHVYRTVNKLQITNSNFINNQVTSVDSGSEGRGGALRVSFAPSGFNINNCLFDSNSAMYGGAIYTPAQDDVSTISNSRFYNNVGTSNGGAIYCNANGTTFYNNEFTNNKANNGAGIFLAYSVYNTDIEDCTFTNNEAIKNGGAIMGIYRENNIQITDSTFNGNSAENGGAISMGETSNNFEVDNCEFNDNEATGYGGCIYFESDGQHIDVTNTNFDNNFASSGGAIHLFSSLMSDSYKDVNILNCDFTNNNCTSSDGRYGGSAIGLNWASDVAIDNCIFNGNNASSNGAILLDYCYDVDVTNSDFISNYAGRFGGAFYVYHAINGAKVTFNKCNFDKNTAMRSGGAISTTLFSINYENLNNVYKNWIITDCDFTNNNAELSGGALYIPWTSNLQINNIPFTGNTAGESTGAMYWSGDKLTINNVNFTDNEAKTGDCGALFIGIGSDSGETSTVSDIKFENNNAYGSGGAISGTASNVDITNVDFNKNSAWYGGAIYWTGGSNINIKKDTFTENHANNAGAIDIYNTANVNIEESSFVKNTATVDAGAIWFNSNGGKIINCEFTENTAGEDGAAVILDSSRQTLTACTFTDNIAGGKGGAIYDTGVGADNSNRISESTFTSNEAYDGGAVYVTDGRITQIYNDTFIDNIASHNGGAAYILVDAKAYVDYDLFKGDGIYRTTDERVTWNVGARQVIYSSLFQKTNLDYYMNVSATVSGLTAVITVTVPVDANKSRNGKVVFDITYTNQTGSYMTRYVLDNFEDNPGTITLNLPSSEVGHYDVVVGFSEDTYLYKQFNVSYNVTDPRGDFEILQGLINDAIANHFAELDLTRSYTFTPGNETNPLDFNVYDIEINAPLIINGNGWTINALGYCRVFTINGNNVVLKDLNIINGANATDGGAICWNGNNGLVEHTDFINNTADANGGAIYFAQTATDNKVLSCTFENNTAGDDGGAIDWDAARGVLNDSTFINNKAGDNGGALCREVNADGGYGNNNIFENNTAYQGGAIAWMKANNIVINNYTFIDNTAEISGGAIYVGEGSGNCIIRNSNFEGNNVTSTSEGHGGAVEWYAKEGAIYTSNFNNNHAYKGGAVFVGLTSGDINITDSKFTYNSAITNGGAIDANASSVIISNSELTGNTAEYGGAVYVGGAGDKNSITSCTFTNNNATYNGGAVDWAASNGNILDSTFEYNNAANGGAVFVGGLAESGSIVNSVFNHNSADEKGGAVTWNATIGKLTGSTFFNNSAQLGGATYRGANSTGGFGQDNTYISNRAELDGGAIYWNGAGGNVTHSEFYNNTAGRNGGAVYVGAVGATAYITDAIFNNNDAGNNGGAVDWAASNGHILRSTFEYNDAVNGGAVFIGGSAEGGSVVNSTFNHNTATENGGAIDWNATIGRLSGSTFFNNSAKYGGAAYRGANSSGGYGYDNIYISNHAEIDGGAIDWNSAGGNITYSEFYNNTAGRNGGAVYVGAVGATAYITDAIFNNNTAEGRGGAVDWDASNGNVLRSTFEYNSADYGGAVFIGGTSGNGTIINSTFNHNHADENGGALDWNSTIGKLINSTFYNNTAKYGGATYRGANSTGGYGYNNVYVSNHAEINGGAIDWNAAGGNVTHSTFRDNTAGNDGGAIYVGAEGATTYITDAKFENNSAGNDGGAVNWDASNGHILESEFNYNTAVNNGGAVFIGGKSGNGTIINSTFNYNHAGENGGAIDWNSTIGKLTGSNFTFNSAKYGGATFRGANATGGYGYNNIYISNYAEINGGAIDWNATGGNITHSKFYNNTAGENGGALFVGAHGATAYITEAVFENNKAGNRGGAIDIYASNTHIIGSNFTSNTADYGGAVFAGHNAELSEISNSTFTSNTATYNGGAVDWNASSGIITGSSFDRNTADYGGAVFVGASTDDGYVLKSNFTNNVAKSRGGAIDWNASNGHVNDSLFEGNEAVDGGAIYVGSGASNGHVYNCTFVSNRADKDKGKGGAILFHTVDKIYVGLSNFTSNSADHAGAIYIEECNGAVLETSEFNSNSANNDGAIHWEGHNGILRDSAFTSNTAVQDAGAIGWKGVESDIYNVTFTKNTAGGKAGAIYWVNVTDDKIYNVTFIENQAFEGGAVYWNSGNGSIYDAKFESNVAFEEGGAVYIDGLSGNALRNATFTSNKATGYFNPQGIEYGDGGAIYITNSENMDLTDLKFDSNAAALNGGAIYINNTDDSSLYGLKFNDNRANKVGGTIYWTSSGNDTIHDISINGSTAHDEGGAIYLNEMEATLENITLDRTTSTYASAGAIYANGNITINNATLSNFKSLNDVASAILFDGGDSSISNSTLNGNNAIVINEATTVHVTKNAIRDDPNEGYAVLNGGTLYLEKNDFDDVIINAGEIKTQTYTVVLGNKTVNATEGDNVRLNASIVDDTKNNDIVVVDSFQFHDITSGKYISSTYSGRANYGTYESVKQGKYIISASDVGLTNNTILTGTLLVKASNHIEFNITQINEGENVTIKVELLPPDNDYPYTGNVSVTVNGKPYNVEIVNGTGILTFTNLTAGTYSVTATYGGDEFHNNATNQTYFVVNLRETLIKIAVDNILYGQNATAVITTNANGTVRVLVNRNWQEVEIVNGTATINITGLDPGKYVAFVIYDGNEYYAMRYNETTFEVYKNNAVIDSIEFERVVPVGKANEITVTMGNVTSGTITIEVNGVNYTAPIVNKVAKLNVSLPVGKDYAVNAYFTGDNYFNATSKVGGTFEVTSKNITVINISSVSVIEVDGKLVINFTTNTTAPLNVTVNGNPVTVENNSIVADTSAVGTYMVIVTSEETATHASGYNSTMYTVIKHNSTVNITVDPLHYVGDTFTITIGNNTNVTVTINGKTYALKADGTVDIDTTALEAGEYIVSAVIAENDKYYGNSSTATFNVVKYNATIDSVEVTPTVEVGQNITVVVTMGNVTSGNVLIEVYGLNYTVPITNGVAKLNVTATKIGNDFGVTAYFLGDSKYNATSKAGNTFNVTGKYPTVINITVDSVVEVDDELIVTITSNTTAPLVVEVNGNPVTLNSTGQFIADTSVAGTYTIIARSVEAEFYYGGFNSTTFTVIKHNSTVNITVDPLHYVEDTFTITIGNNTNVTVTINGKTYAVKADGTVDIDTTALAAGEYVVSAVIAENDKYYGNSTSATFNIVKYNAEIISVVADPSVVADGQNTTFTVTFGNVTTGTVEIEVNGQNYTTSIVNGVATLNLTLPVGKYANVTAYFLGDYKYNATNKTGNAFEVTDKNITYIIINVDKIVEVDDTVIVTLDTNTTADLIVTINGQAVTVENNQFVANTSAAGTYTIIARANENEHYSAGYNSTVYTVIKHNSTVNITVGPVHFVEDDFTIKIGNNTNVTVTINGKAYEIKADGTVDIDTTVLAAGEYVVSAVIAENNKYYGNSTSATFKVVKYNAEIVSVEEAPVVAVGQNNTIIVTMGNITSGEITIEVNGQNYTVPIVDKVAKLNVTLPIGKDYPVKAYFLGDYKHNATSMVGDPFEVTDKNVTIIEIESISVVEVDSKLIINITTNTTANLIVTVNGKTAALNSTGQFIADTSAAGTYTIVARAYENQFYSAGYNSTVYTVVKHNSTVDIAVDPVHYVGDEFTINVTSNTTVTVTINGKSYAINANGTVNIDTTVLEAGEYTVIATVTETDKYYGNSSTATFKVVKYNAVIESVVAAPGVVFVGQNTTITVTMANVTDGVITIEVNGQNYTANIVNKVAKLNVTLPVGNGYAVTAYYLGDRTYNATNKTGNTFDVTDKNITVITIDVESVVVVDDKLIVTLATNTNATLNVTVNGKEVTLNATNQFVADTSAVGTYTIVARASENEYYSNGFNSTTFTVIKHNSTVDIAVDPVHFVGDDFTINVTSNTTTVTVTINGKSYEIGADGTVVIDTSALEAGEYTVIATVTENDKYYGNSSTATFKVVKYNATITSVEVTPTTEIGQNITVVVTMGNVTEGNVLIEVYGLNYTVPIVDSVATLNITATVIGDNFGVNAYFLGDNKHNATEKAGNTFNVTGKYPTVITIDVESVVEVDDELIVTIKTNSTSPLNVTVNGQPVTLNSTGQFIADTSVVGTYTIIATTEEGAFYYGGFNSTTFTVIKHNATVNVTVDPIHYVEDVFTVNITNNTAVNVTINGKTYAVKADGTVDIDTAALEAGEYTVVATVTENDKYYGNSSTATFKVVKYNAAIESVVAEPLVVFVGQNTAITVTMANVTDGVITIEVDGQNYTANIVNKVAKLNVTLPVGKYANVTAYFLGDYKYNATNMTGNAFEVTDKNVTVINITVASIVVVDDELIVTIETNTNATLNVTVNGKPVTLDADGKFTADTSAAGTYTIVARASENEYYSNGFNSTTFEVIKHNSTVDIAVDPVHTVGDNFAIIVTSNTTVTVTINGKEYSIDADGAVIIDTTSLYAGEYIVTATVAESDKYYGNTSTKVFRIDKLASTVNVTAESIVYGNDTEIIVKVPTEQTGFVTIAVGGQNYTDEIKNGEVRFIIPGLDVDTYTVDVTFLENGKYNASTNSTTFEVTKANLTAKVIANNITVLDNSTFIVSVDPNFKGNVSITVDGVTYDGGVELLVDMGKLAAGDKTATVKFYGDDNYDDLTMDVNFTVSKLDTPINVVHDGKGTVTVVVPDNATGNVTITVDGKTFNGTIENGTATIYLENVSSGEYNITVTYPGDDIYKNATLNATIEIKKLSTPISVNVTDIYVGDVETIVVTLPDDATGNVTISVDGKSYTQPIVNGNATFTISDLTYGNKTVAVSYIGDGEYDGNFTSANFIVSKRESFVNVDVEATNVGSTVTISVEIPANATGLVVVSVDGTNYTVNTTGGNGSVAIPGVGNTTHTVKVTYLGDGQYLPSNNETTYGLAKVDSSVKVEAENITFGDREVITVAVPTDATGNVTVDVVGVGTYTVAVANGTGVLVVKDIAVGDYTVKVTYNGDDKYKTSENETTFKVSKIVTKEIEVVDQGNGTVVVFVPGNGTGNVTITVNGTNYTGPVINGTAVITLENVTPGENNITVIYSGDENHTGITKNATVVIPKYDTPIKVSVGDIYVGDIAHVVVELPENVTGSVTIEIDGKSYTNSTIVAGKATFDVEGVLSGNKTVTVTYSGDSNYTGNFTTGNFTVSKRQSFVNVNVEATNVGSTVTISVEVPANATGIVVVSVDGTNYTVSTTGGKGKLEIEGVGNTTHTVEVTYMGDDQYLSSTNSTTYGLSKVESTITVEAANIYKGDVEELVIKVSSGATGNVTIKIGEEYEKTVGVTDGTISVLVSDLTSGEKTVEVTYNGDAKYLSSKNSTTFKVLIKDAVILSNNVTAYYNQTEFAIRLADTSNNPIAGETVEFAINGKAYTAVTDEYGNAKISLELPLGSYTIETSYTDALGKQIKVTNTIDMLSSIRASDLTRGWNSPYDYMAVFLDGDGHVLVNKEVSFIVNGKTYNAKTDAKGIALLDTSKLAIGKYKVTLVNNVTGEKTTRTTNIVARLIENKDITMDFVDGTCYVVRVIGDDGKPVGEGEIVDMYANTVHYVAHTDKDGYARLVINLNPNTYKLTAEYKQYKVGNTLVVKQTLKLVKKTVKAKKGKKFKLKAKLKWSSGKAIAGKKIVFKFKGKKYTAKTNSKGIAKVTIKKSVAKKLKKGKKYKYSATYITNIVKGKVKIK